MQRQSKETVTSFRVRTDLWREARAYAVRYGITVKQLLEFLLTQELKENKILKELTKEAT